MCTRRTICYLTVRRAARTSHDVFAELLSEIYPFQQRIQSWTQRLPPVREAVLDLGRHLMMNEAADDPIPLHLSKLLNQHLFGDCGDRPPQLGKAPDGAAEEVGQTHELPAAFENPQNVLDALRGGRERVFLLTFR